MSFVRAAELVGPFAKEGLKRNPAAKNAGKFMTLPGFLDLAKASNVSGILIDIKVSNIQFIRPLSFTCQSVCQTNKLSKHSCAGCTVQHAAYLATKGLGVVDAVTGALTKAGYDKETKKHVLIQSEDSSVLLAFKKSLPASKRVLSIDTDISDVAKPSVDDIKGFADGVKIRRSSVAQMTGYFMTHFTNVVGTLQAANLTVFIGVLRNEFMNLGFDYFADPLVEVATYSDAVMADGLITEFPATAAEYFSEYLPCFFAS